MAVDTAAGLVVDVSARISPVNLAATFLVCIAIYLWRKPGQGFLAWLLPARVYRNRGFGLDIKIFLINQGVRIASVVLYVGLTAAAAAGIASLFGILPDTAAPPRPLLVALVAILAADFVNYWYHRIFHDVPTLWAFHALHHSAEELSPITSYRHHPAVEFIGLIINAASTGLVQGLLLAFLVGSLDAATLAGTNVFYAVFNLLTANLRHSHIWLRYPRFLEHILISPAQHQVHHSVEPRHYNRNYGEVLAIWDWMFGTLYLTKPGEVIRFGLGDAEGKPLAQPHPDLRHAFLVPFRQAARILRDDPAGKAEADGELPVRRPDP